MQLTYCCKILSAFYYLLRYDLLTLMTYSCISLTCLQQASQWWPAPGFLGGRSACRSSSSWRGIFGARRDEGGLVGLGDFRRLVEMLLIFFGDKQGVAAGLPICKPVSAQNQTHFTRLWCISRGVLLTPHIDVHISRATVRHHVKEAGPFFFHLNMRGS